MQPHLWQGGQWFAGTAQGDPGNLPVACGDGLVEASVPLEATPDWKNDLFKSACKGEGDRSCPTHACPCHRDESPLPHPSHGLEKSSCHASWVLFCVQCFPGLQEFPHGFLRVQSWAQILALPLPAARAKMQVHAKNCNMKNKPTGSSLQPNSALGHA